MLILIEENGNGAEAGCWRFNVLDPPRPVTRVRLHDRSSAGEWCDVVGWTDRPAQPMSPAVVQKIDDSGLGVAYLISGGEWGLRLKPVDDASDWSLHGSRQWGVPYLVVGSPADFLAAEPARRG
jgi:hypothetical protein